MADFVFKNGKEVVFDFEQITAREFKELFDPAQPAEREFMILGKASGMTAKEVGDLTRNEWRRFAQAFFKAAQEPLTDPK